VSLVGDERGGRIPGRRVMEWRALFPATVSSGRSGGGLYGNLVLDSGDLAGERTGIVVGQVRGSQAANKLGAALGHVDDELNVRVRELARAGDNSGAFEAWFLITS